MPAWGVRPTLRGRGSGSYPQENEWVCLVKTWSTRFIDRLSCVDADHVAPGIVVVICALRA